MKFYNKTVARILHNWPGKKFGLYRYLPVFVLLGAALEFTMIKWDVNGQVNFYRTFKRRQAKILAAEALE